MLELHVQPFADEPVDPIKTPGFLTRGHSKRLKKDRFTTEILESYCKKLGIDVFNLEFYSDPSVFVERLVPEEAS